MKKNCIILHGCPSSEEKALSPKLRTFDKHWIPWTKKQLTEHGYDVVSPLMPRPWEPVYEDFKIIFDSLEVNDKTVLIGHSCGSAFLVRWLGDTKKQVSKLILIAPWKVADENSVIKKDFYEFPVDESVKERVGKIVIFTSDNEEQDGKKSSALFHELLGGELIELPSHGHYTIGDMSTEEFPELIESILST